MIILKFSGPDVSILAGPFLEAKAKAINDYITDRGKQNDGVIAIDVVPKTYVKFFKKDKIHFNRRGMNHYARNITRLMVNFLTMSTNIRV